MAFNIEPGESYTMRTQVFKLLGAAFHVYDPAGRLVGYCKQKAFKLKEDLRICTDESCAQELMVIRAKSIIDFGATYDVTLPTGEAVGSLRRKGLTSSFLRDEWLIFGRDGRQIGRITEDSGTKAFLRRYIDFMNMLLPQTFHLVRDDGAMVAAYRTHFNLFVHRMSVSVFADDPEIDDLVILAAGCLLAAIEGRQG